MTKKRITGIVMLVVLVIGIALAAYGVTGRNIYNNAAAMMGADLKTAMTNIQEPDKMTEIGAVSKIGADGMKSFLKSLGLESAAVDGAVDAIARADLLIIAGTSMSVYPAAGLVQYFRGKHMVIINKSSTAADSMCDLVINGSVGRVLSAIEVR